MMNDPNYMCDSLFSSFTISKKKRNVYFHKGVLVWDCQKFHCHHVLSLKDMICVRYAKLAKCDNLVTSLPEVKYKAFKIYYGKRSSRNKWKFKCVIFFHSEPSRIKLWVKTLQNSLNSLKKRPKRLLLFINPFSGTKNGMVIFEKHAKLLFTIACINVTVVVSQRQNQIKDCLLSLNLDIYDSVACVGGDGTFSELFNGLVIRRSKEQNINIDDIEAELLKPKLPVGIIPAGSTNTIAYCIHGTTDVETAVLHIIFGDSLGFDLVSVYNEDHLLKLYGSLISYGYLGDVALESEKYRWMGPKRYDYTGMKKFVANSGYNIELAFCSEERDEEEIETKCVGYCDTCNIKAQILNFNKKKDWKIVKGNYFMVSAANISCACARSPNGLSPYSHLGDGYIDLILVRHTNIINNIRLLIALSSRNKSVKDLPFVELFRTQEFCFRASPCDERTNDSALLCEFSKWNCDGEVICDTNLRVKVRRQLLTVLTRGSQYDTHVFSCC